MESDPDVTIAMDILGFALYHEQTESSLSHSTKRDREDSDDNVAIIPSSQRIRTVEEDDLPEEHSITKSDPVGQYKSKVWESLSSNDGQMDISELRLDDTELLERALTALEKEQRIYRSGLTLFQI